MSNNRISQLLAVREDLMRAGEDVSHIDAELIQMGFTRLPQANGGRIGYNMGGPIGYNMGGMGGDMGMGSGMGNLELAQAPGRESEGQEAQLIKLISSIQDPAKKIKTAIMLLLQVGEEAIPLLEKALSPEEFGQMSAQLESMPENEMAGGVAGLDQSGMQGARQMQGIPEMAANGGRMGYQNGMMVASADPDTNPDDRLLDDPEGMFNTSPEDAMKLIETAMPGANPSDVVEAYDRAVLQGFQGSILEFIMIMGGDRRDLGKDMGANPQGIMSTMRA